jgi:predicted metal-dependent hydrolase
VNVVLREETRAALAEGRRLFNAGRFFESHEVWEAAWLREETEVRTLLQGLIQVAAGFHQALDRRNASGCTRLLAAGLARLERLTDGFAGVALAGFRNGVGEAIARAREWESGGDPLGSEDAPSLGLAEE